MQKVAGTGGDISGKGRGKTTVIFAGTAVIMIVPAKVTASRDLILKIVMAVTRENSSTKAVHSMTGERTVSEGPDTL
jgi:hypothetical protein